MAEKSASSTQQGAASIASTAEQPKLTSSASSRGRFNVSILGRTPERARARVAGGRFKVIAVPHDGDSAAGSSDASGGFSRAGSLRRGGTIVKVDKELYALPARDRIAAAELVVVTVHTDTNVLGRGFVCVPCRAGLAVAALVDELQACILGRRVSATEPAYEAMHQATRLLGSTGAAALAIAAVDIAMWDARARSAQAPLWELLGGGQHGRTRCYAAVDPCDGRAPSRGDCETDDGLLPGDLEALERAVTQGFAAVKLQVGFRSLQADMHRIKHFKELTQGVGAIMIDASEITNTSNDINRAAHVLAGMDILWLEAPLHVCRRLSSTSPITIANSRLSSGLVELRRTLEGRAVDYPQADVAVVGGITGWWKCAIMCEAFQLPISGVGVMDGLQASLVASANNGEWLEVIIDNPLKGFVKVHHKLSQGVYELSAQPGLGVELELEELKPFKVDATLRNMAEVV